MKELEKMGVAADDGTNRQKLFKDNTNVYIKVNGIDDKDIKFLLSLDKDIERLYEAQLRKRNKNDEMIRNKINDLNKNPLLRDLLFKRVSDNQLLRDNDELEQ